jgi:hypothetical protein
MRALLADSLEATGANQQERILAICRGLLGETGEAEEVNIARLRHAMLLMR